MKKKVEYDEYMDKDCIEVCDLLNSYPGVETFESCCGHFKSRYDIFFRCNNFITLAKLFRCVNRNYSSGEFEILLDGTDVTPCCCFWLRSKEIFKNQEEMDSALDNLKDNLKYYLDCDKKTEEYFQSNGGNWDKYTNKRKAFVVTLGVYIGSDPFTGEQIGDTDMLTICDTLEDAQAFIEKSVRLTADANKRNSADGEEITHNIDWPEYFQGRCAQVLWKKKYVEDGEEKEDTWFYDYGILERFVYNKNEDEDRS